MVKKPGEKDSRKAAPGSDYCMVSSTTTFASLGEKTIQFLNIERMTLLGFGLLERKPSLFRYAYEMIAGENVNQKYLDELVKKIQDPLLQEPLWYITIIPRAVRFEPDDLETERQVHALFKVAA